MKAAPPSHLREPDPFCYRLAGDSGLRFPRPLNSQNNTGFGMMHYDVYITPPYNALSHVRGEPEFSKEVNINGRTLATTIAPD